MILTDPSGILALDPAWTPRQPSGVAALACHSGTWRCLGVAPSYISFVELARGEAVDWSARPAAGIPDPGKLLDAAQVLLGGPVSTVTIDMPVSRVPFDSRRNADNLVSTVFGRYGCGTHTPNKDRPGPLGMELTREFAECGYDVAGEDTVPGNDCALVEVYPHPALLVLLGEDYRVKYKAGKARRFWPDLTAAESRAEVVVVWARILEALQAVIAGIELSIPTASEAAGMTTAWLKRYEDALDALVCGWIGIEYLEGRCTAYGDASAAIWTPEYPRSQALSWM